MNDFSRFLLVFLGAGIGGCLRYAVGLIVPTRPDGFPWATFSINVLGSLMIGLSFGLMERFGLGGWWRPLVIVGLLGGFTTFSSFSFETLTLLQGRQFGVAAAYVVGSCGVGLLVCVAGYVLTRGA